jgi:hypothetical protein
MTNKENQSRIITLKNRDKETRDGKNREG